MLDETNEFTGLMFLVLYSWMVIGLVVIAFSGPANFKWLLSAWAGGFLFGGLACFTFFVVVWLRRHLERKSH
jgi:hypothetical protein